MLHWPLYATHSAPCTKNSVSYTHLDVYKRQDAASILAQIDQWWSEEPEDQRDELRDELRQSRSIPQELDRQLLLRVSRELGRPLSWPDEKVMREGLSLIHI